MIAVDMIGRIRRAYFDRQRSIKEIVRTLSVSREDRARVPARAFVPMSFAPGEAYQFDWSHETITLQACR